MATATGLFSDDPWQLAKARFLADLDPQEQALFNHATLENLFYTTSNTNRDDAESSKVRFASSKLGPFLAAIENYGKALDIFSSIAPLYIAPIWGSIRVVLVLAKSHGKFFDRIVETLERIGDILPRFRDYERLYNRTKHQRLTQALSNAYLEIIVFCTQIRNSLRRQKTSTVRRLLKPLSLDREFGEAVNRFRQHKQNVEDEARTCHMIEASEEINTQMVLRSAEVRAKLLAKLSKVDCKIRHRKLVESRHEGTGLWLTATEEYQKWDKDQGSTVLCCYGIPGSGKSVLASSVIDLHASDQNTLFYYCDYADKRTLEPANVFGTLTRQLLGSIEPIPDDLATEIEKADHDGERMLDHKKTLLFFKRTIELSSGLVRVVFDGLDETTERSQECIMAGFRALLEGLEIKFKLLITGREELGSSLQLCTNTPKYKVLVSADAIALDIEAYVQASTRRRISDGSLVIRDANLEELIVEALVQGAKGMFLWVEFQLQDLSEQESDYGIKDVLQNLPRSLSETYDRLLAKIEGAERRVYIERIFRWLVAARQPLHVDEMLEAIAFTLNDTFWDREKIPTDFSRFVRACGNLVVVDPETQIIQLAHYTVEQYILQSSGNTFHFELKEANASVGEICVAYLNFTNFDTHVVHYKENKYTDMAALSKLAGEGQLISSEIPGRELVGAWNTFRSRASSRSRSIDMTQFVPARGHKTSNFTTFSLLKYVRAHWLWHTISFQLDDAHSISDISARNRRDDLFTKLVLWKEHTFEFRPWQSFSSTLLEPALFSVSLFGWALHNNHGYLISILFLSKRIPPPDPILSDTFALFLPDWYDGVNEGQMECNISEKMLETLDRHGDLPCLVDVHPTGWIYSKLLHACRSGHLDALEAASFSRSLYDNPVVLGHMLVEAAKFGHLSLVEFIVRSPMYGMCDITTGARRLNAVDQAAYGSHLATVIFLIRHGCQLGNMYHDKGSFLQLLNDAIAIDDRNLVEILLWFEQTESPDQVSVHPKFAIELSPQEQAGAVFSAIRQDRASILQLLIENGFSQDPAANSGFCALGVSACTGNISTTQCLISQSFDLKHINLTSSCHGHDVDMRLFLQPTPLYIACFHGNLEIVQSLVHSGANVQLLSPVAFMTIQAGDTQLYRAPTILPFSLEGLGILISKGESQAQNKFLSSWQFPITAALIEGHFHVAQFLIQAGASSPTEIYIKQEFFDPTSRIPVFPRLSMDSNILIRETFAADILLHSSVIEEITRWVNQTRFLSSDALHDLVIMDADVERLYPEGVNCFFYATQYQDATLSVLVLDKAKHRGIFLDGAMHDAAELSEQWLLVFLIQLLKIISMNQWQIDTGLRVDIRKCVCESIDLRQSLLDRFNPRSFARVLGSRIGCSTAEFSGWILVKLLSEVNQRITSLKWCLEMMRVLPSTTSFRQGALQEALRCFPNAVLKENLLFLTVLLQDYQRVEYIIPYLDEEDVREDRLPRLLWRGGFDCLMQAITIGASKGMLELLRPGLDDSLLSTDEGGEKISILVAHYYSIFQAYSTHRIWSTAS